jgi:uncharacterized RDD family membrane protein YckC
MKCPKCGFTSFDDLQDCRKCGDDLSVFQSKFSLRSLLRPFAAPAVTPEQRQRGAAPEASVSSADAIDFDYDFMEETGPASSLDNDSKASAQRKATEFDFQSHGEPLAAIPDFTELDFLKDRPEKKDALDFGNDFSWDDTTAAGPASRNEGPEKKFDLPSLEELPPLEGLGEALGGETAELSDFPDIPNFDDLEEDLPSKKKGESRAPFDKRGTVDTNRPPAHSIPAAPQRPPTPDEPPFRAPRVSCAPVALRLRAAIIDTAILTLAFALFMVSGEMILQGGVFPSAETLSTLAIPYFLIFFLLCFGYFTLFHALTGQTVGKMLFGLRVEGIDGDPVLFSQAFLRAAGGVLCLIPLGIGFLHILRAPEGRGWNDRLGGTWVVLVRGEEEEEIGEEEFAV